MHKTIFALLSLFAVGTLAGGAPPRPNKDRTVRVELTQGVTHLKGALKHTVQTDGTLSPPAEEIKVKLTKANAEVTCNIEGKLPANSNADHSILFGLFDDPSYLAPCGWTDGMHYGKGNPNAEGADPDRVVDFDGTNSVRLVCGTGPGEKKATCKGAPGGW